MYFLGKKNWRRTRIEKHEGKSVCKRGKVRVIEDLTDWSQLVWSGFLVKLKDFPSFSFSRNLFGKRERERESTTA